MLLIVEGQQGSGKSYLINNCKFRSRCYKFDFSKYINNLLIKDKKTTFGFGLGKDLDLIQFHQENSKLNTIADRNFLSTLVYRRIFKKVPMKKLDEYFNFIINMIKTGRQVRIIIVVPNKEKIAIRNRNDGFDFLGEKSKEQEEMYAYWTERLKKEIPKYVHIFNNDFDKQSILRFNKLLNPLFGDQKK